MVADSAAAFFRAEALRRDGRAEEAAQAYRDLVQAHAGHAAAWRGLAAVLDSLQRPGEAAEARRAADAAEADAIAGIGASLLFGGDADRAKACFDRALERDADCLRAHWLLGELHGRRGEREAAIAHYCRCREIAPERTGPDYMIAALGAGPVPGRAPEDYVVAFFDWYADRFDEHLTRNLAYTGPRVVAEALALAVPDGPGHVLDLGCGTGLAGAALAGVTLAGRAGRLTGIDLSPAMLARAAARGIYDRLIEGEIGAALDALPAGSADAAVAADALVYLGDLAPLFAALDRVLTPGGVLVATFEALGSSDDGGWSLGATGRYRHGAGYLRRCAGRAGLAAERVEAVAVRTELGLPVEGLLGVFRKAR